MVVENETKSVPAGIARVDFAGDLERLEKAEEHKRGHSWTHKIAAFFPFVLSIVMGITFVTATLGILKVPQENLIAIFLMTLVFGLPSAWLARKWWRGF